MERRDILKDEIEQLGKVLGHILATFMGLSSKGKVSEGIEEVSNQLKDQLNLDFEKILQLSGNELLDYLKQWNITSEHLEMLSNLLVESGRAGLENCEEEAVLRIQKALELLDLADVLTKTVSLERESHKSGIQQLLKHCI